MSSISDEHIRVLCQRVISAQSAQREYLDAVFALRSALSERFEDVANVNAAIKLKMQQSTSD